MRRNPLRNLPRNVDVDALHETFFIAAVTTILCIRTQLWLTNYPQLGGSGLHIAHLLWGGLFMTAAIGLLITLIGRRVRQLAALVGGVGFGFFIDELGKFITADNNYFFRPAAALIYLIFVVLFLGSRAYRSRRDLTDAERLRNAIELISESVGQGWSQRNHNRAVALLEEVPAGDPLREQLLAMTAEIDATPDPDPPWYGRLADQVAVAYRGWTEHGWFHRLVFAVFVLWAAASLATIAGLVLSFGFAGDAARVGFQEDSFSHLDFLNWATLVSTAVSAAFVVLGLARLARRQRLDAYVWFIRALLVSIFVTRVFTFVESQFGAVFGLAVDVLLLISVQLMAEQERGREAG